MIATITMNPCIDKTIRIEKFTYGATNYVVAKRKDLSGKGINTSIVLENLGFEEIAFGLIYENDKEYMLLELEKNKVDFKGVVTDGNLRENIKLLNEENMITTEFNQKGEEVSKQSLEMFEALLEAHIDKIDIVVVSGSVPSGVDKNIYYRILKKFKDRNVITLLDADGDLFLDGMKAKPNIIKPNIYELSKAYGLDNPSLDEVLNVCDNIVNNGVDIVCVSMGERGAIIVDKNEAYLCSNEGIDVNVISTQGAGDSLVAGLCIAYSLKKNLEEMLIYGVAAALGSLEREGTLLCEKESFEKNISVLKCKKIR